ncbi:propionyl-CoA carboxylase [Phenylobacterium zucineum HLK1]|uniref:Propionyl-CoA carboxylase n=1 Tax=Phenylobacterium zucineum (strain HLK1) TaxID=450851 RepID=B4RH21_PHEZH|nr:carboxyl transferase domain-containing protein [Phenylobacterium zucineum]ACG78969.1 propionyl-CoA carboxylase [Phenylobacterium zucineum HLK1]
MDWSPEVEALRRRRAAAARMGGEAAVEKHHNAGRLTVRERIALLLDADSFEELGGLTGSVISEPDGEGEAFTAANIVLGLGRVDGRRVVVVGDDFTIRGGSSEASSQPKQRHAEQLPHEFRLPLIRLVDGSGGGGSVRELERLQRTYVPLGRYRLPTVYLMAKNLAEVPVVGLCLGSVAGLGAMRVAASHYSMMIRDTSHLFVAGPPLVGATGEKRTKEELGGASVHGTSGAVDDVVDSEAEAFSRTRRFLSYLPSSIWELPERVEPTDDPERREESLLSIVPRERRRPYLMRKIIEAVVDRGSFFEISRAYGKSIVTGLARLDGWPVAVMAGDPYTLAGAWTAQAAQKITRFIDMANTFHLPVVHLVDCPGFEIGLRGETANTLRHGARAFFAINQFTGPWCSVIVRNAFGLGGAAHQPINAPTQRFAWPSGRWGSLPTEGGIEAAYRAEIEAAEDPEAARAEIYRRLESLQSPMRTAEAYDIEDVVDPRETRPLLCRFANMAAPLRKPGPVSLTMRP